MRRIARTVGHLTAPALVQAIHVYPIKSCGGVSVTTARVVGAGLEWDREFCLVDEDGDVLSQKTHPVLATIRPALDTRDGHLVALTLCQRDRSACRVPMNGVVQALATRWSGRTVPLRGLHYPAADAWLAAAVGFPCRLCRLAERAPLSRTRLAEVSEPEDAARFHDAAPVSVLSVGSVTRLNARLRGGHVGPERFRPNIVVTGCPAHAEDGWARARVGSSVELRMLMQDYRCTMVTIEQNDGTQCGRRPSGREVQDVLREYRVSPPETAGPLCRDAPNFGVYAAVDEGGRVTVGDEVVPTRQLAGAPSIYLFNRHRLGTGRYRMTADRFWEPVGG